MGAVPAHLPAADPASDRVAGSVALSASLLTGAYVAAGLVGLFALWPASGPSVFWPASGVAAGWLVRFGLRAWPGVFVGGFVINTVAGNGIAQTAVLGLGNAAGAVLAAWLVRRIAGPGFTLDKVRGVTAVLGAAVVGSVPAAVVGPLVMWWQEFLPPAALGMSAFVWWLGDAAGVVLVAPVVLARLRLVRVTPKLALTLLGMALLAALTVAIGLSPSNRRLAAMGPCLALVVWAAVRFGPRGVAVANLMTGVVVWLLAFHGGAPFPQSLAAFAVVVSLTALYLGAVFAERDADLDARKRAEAQLARRERLLQAVSTTAARLLAGPSAIETLPPVLALLGDAAGVNRAYVLSFRAAGDETFAKLVHEWETDPPIGPASDLATNPLPVREAGFGRWLDLLERGEAVHGPVAGLPPGERPFLESQSIRSLLVAPIAAGELWGVVGFEDCVTDRVWSPAEVDAIRAAAAALGGAIRRERTEAQSLATQERLRALLEHSQDVTAVLSAGGVVGFVSEAAERIAGYRPDQLRGRPALDFVHPDDVPIARLALADCLAHPEVPVRTEFRFRTAAGGWVWLEAIGTNLLHNPAVGGVVLNGRDVTERREAEGELLRARELLESTGRMARIGGWEYAPPDQLVWSEQTYRIHEVDPASFTPTVATAIAFYAPEARPVIAAAVERGMSTGEPWNLILPFDTARGRRLWVNAIGHAEFRDGKPHRLCGTFQDVTDRVNAERVVEESEARYRHLFENAPVAIWEEDLTAVGDWFGRLRAAGVTDLAAHLEGNPDDVTAAVGMIRVRDVNRAAVEMHRAADKAELTADLLRLFTPATLAAFADELVALWGGARHIRLDTPTRTLGGGEIDAVLHFHIPEIDGRADLTKVVLIAFDVTGQRRLEEQFRQASKLEAVGRLAGGIAHDFNNLLTVINGFSEMLVHQSPAGSPARDLAGQIHDAGARAAALTRQLLAFGRRHTVPTTAVDVRAVVDGLVPLLAPLVGEATRLVVEPGPHPPPIRADRGQIEQVVMNLCLNARDAMPVGGTLTVSTGFVDLGDGAADDVPAGRYVVLSVADTGEGIPEAIRPHLFDPFFTTK
ncbi:MAG TPA: PAS domain S-box protein, partial [Gemmataceae bacterium]|nr:PAS domain S-box protein [Gemmataceae bacterium]